MKLRWTTIRNSMIALAFAGSIGFGLKQATASDAPKPAGCNSFACRAECPGFGGELGPGGPGKPLQCFCCG